MMVEQGERVRVTPRVLGSPDRYNNRKPEDGEPYEVDGVLCAPLDADASVEEGRPYGAQEGFTLYFPKGTARNLRGAKVEVRGKAYEVQGAPQAWNVPADFGYDTVAKAVRQDG